MRDMIPKVLSIDQRSHQRVPLSFPVDFKHHNVGEAVNVSRGGLCLSLEWAVSNSPVLALELELPFAQKKIRVFGEKVWERMTEEKRRCLVGLKFINSCPEDLQLFQEEIDRRNTLRVETAKVTMNRIRGQLISMSTDSEPFDGRDQSLAYKKEPGLDETFKQRVKDLAGCLCVVKNEFGRYDVVLNDQQKMEKLKEGVRDIFPVLDRLFDQIWESFMHSSKEDFDAKKEYYEAVAYPFLGEGIDTNTYIRERPLGYVGDFVTMNFIYDYYDKAFFGSSLYSKLINKYTCNIDVASSNIARKDYIKKAISETLKQNKNASILSIGCGPARELTELLEEKKIHRATIHLLDLEKKAILYVQNRLSTISFDRSKIDIQFHVMDLMEVVKDNRFLSLFPDIDLLYASGVFDYLSNRVAKKTYARLFAITKRNLLVFNMSLENARHRAYYEIFGNWNMYHRRKEELLEWGRGLPSLRAFSVESPKGCNSYWILKASKA